VTTVDYRGQLVGAIVQRSVLGVAYRVRLTTDKGYFLAWVPRWKVMRPQANVRQFATCAENAAQYGHEWKRDRNRLREALDTLVEALAAVDVSGQIGDVENYDEALIAATEAFAPRRKGSPDA
jgi:phage terminase large subunit GpA-like protein